MSTPQQPAPTDAQLAKQQQVQNFLHNIAIGSVILCPLVIALPPRKLDFYTFSLMAGTFVAGNHLVSERYGKSVLQSTSDFMNDRVAGVVSGDGLPEKAREMQMRIKEEKARLGIKTEKEKSAIEKLWMGEEKEDWKIERDRREKEALEDGRGYGGLIADQIWEVWNWGKKNAEEIEEIDKKVIEERKNEK